MTQLKPAYRMTVYSPRSVDSTETTPLTPALIHSDQFKVATIQGVSGYQPYMDMPRGERGSFTLPDFKSEVGRFRIPLLDKSFTPGNNLTRWVTAFIGDASGKVRLKGRKVVIEESTDAGSTWSLFFVGRISDVSLDDPLRYSIDVRDSVEDMKGKVFTNLPTVGYSVRQWLLPVGLSADYGNITASTALSGSVGTSGIMGAVRISVTKADRSRTDNVFTGELNKAGYTAGASADNLATVYVRKTSGATGTFRLGFADSPALRSRGIVRQEGNFVTDVDLLPFPTSSAMYTPTSFVTPGDNVTFYVVKAPALGTDGETAQPTVILSNVHPVQVWKDLLDGAFSPVSGAAPIPYHSGAFASLLSDQTIPSASFVIKKDATMVDFIEDAICKPYSLGYTIVPTLVSGVPKAVVYPFKTTLPSALPSVTLTDADVIASEEPTWTAGDPYTLITYRYYQDIPANIASQNYRNDNSDDVAVFKETDFLIRSADLTDLDAPQKSLTIDAVGLRSTRGSGIANQLRTIWAAGKARELLQPYISRYGYGAATVELPCRRSSNVTGLTVGDWVLVDVDKLPDSATHLRGGIRLMQLTGKSEDGIAIRLTLMDGSVNAVCTVPTVGTLSLSAQTITVPVTGSAVYGHVQYAVTPKTDSQPVEASSLWTTAEIKPMNGGTTFTISNVPQSRRVYVRVRSESLPSADLKLPSAWTSPSPAYVDVADISAPSGLTVSNVSTKYAVVSWTNGSSTAPLEVLLASPATDPLVTIAKLKEGSTRFTLRGLDKNPSTLHSVGVRHVDPVAGYSTTTAQDFFATGSASVLPDLSLMVYIGD